MCLYDVTVVTLGARASGVSAVEVGCCGNPCNEARFVSYSHTHRDTWKSTHLNWTTLSALNIVIMAGWPWKINRFISSPFLSLPLTPLCFSAPLSVILTLRGPHPPVLSPSVPTFIPTVLFQFSFSVSRWAQGRTEGEWSCDYVDTFEIIKQNGYHPLLSLVLVTASVPPHHPSRPFSLSSGQFGHW